MPFEAVYFHAYQLRDQGAERCLRLNDLCGACESFIRPLIEPFCCNQVLMPDTKLYADNHQLRAYKGSFRNLPAFIGFLLSDCSQQFLVDKTPVSLALSRRLNLTSVHNLVRHDQDRAKALRLSGSANPGALDSRAVINSPVTNQAVTYVASVGIGSPPTNYNLIVDTGSSNTWVGADKSYKQTNTSETTFELVFVSYGSGEFSGFEFTDTVTIAPGLVVDDQSIGDALFSTGFNGVDGILGLGPVDLTANTIFFSTETIPTVTDNLFSQGTIPQNMIAVSFEPTTTIGNQNGKITWGGTDDSQFTGSIAFTPMTTVSPASKYWGIDQSIRYGSSNTILSTNAGIVDTGTTLLMIATDAFSSYKNATGAVLDPNTELLSITPEQLSNLQSLFFHISGVDYEFTANAQLWPRSLNTNIGGTVDKIYLIVADIGTASGQGLDFINGMAFLERFYSVYDTGNKQVGFAITPFTGSTTN